MYFDFKEIVEGTYQSGIFMLGINKCFTDGMNWNSFSEIELATFVHEYVHYLQDISTFQGLMRYIHRADLFQLYIALAQKNLVVSMPVDLENSGVKNAYAKNELISFYEGDSLQNKIHHVNEIRIETEELLDEILFEKSDYKGKPVPKVSLYFNNEPTPTLFGSHYITESMAYLIERLCFGAEEREKELPYNACEMLCAKVYPEIMNHPENIVILCEFALMHEHSGFAFYSALVELERNRFVFENTEKLKQFLINDMKVGIKKLDHAYERVQSCIDLLFSSTSPYMYVPNNYIKSIFNSGCTVRKADNFFISSILMDSLPLDRFKTWMDRFPLPLFIDNQNEHLGLFEELAIIPVPYAILDFFERPSKGCGLLDYCKYSNIKNLEESNCKNAPWKQCQKRELCPLALYFKAFGLDKKIFDVKK